MGFRDNSVLIRTATVQNVTANDTADVFHAENGANAFVFADGKTGDDTIVGFGSDDSIINYKAIFDGNKDGYISFGPNAQLDIDRTSAKNAGDDQVTVVGTGENRVTEIRYLGTKDGGFVYADASTRDSLLGHFTKGFDNSAGGGTGGDSTIAASITNRVDNDVSDNTFNFGRASSVLLTDNALGLNFGGDTINGFGNDDLLVFTSKIYDSDGSGRVTFGKNAVLDLSGANGPSNTDPSKGPGGQLDLNDPNQVQVFYLGEHTTADGHTYYYYGTAGTTVNPFAPHGEA